MGGEGNSSEPKVSGDRGEQINIRCPNGSKFSVKASLDSTVGDFKAILAQNCDIPAEHQRLIYQGRVLKDDQTLTSYGLQADHTIHMVRAFAAAASTPAAPAANATSASPNTAPGVARGVGSTERDGLQSSDLGASLLFGQGLNPLGDGGGAPGLFGAGLPEFEQVQQQLTQNPNMMRDIMNMPAIQSLMNNPDLMRGLIMNNLQMRDIINRNPELAHILNHPMQNIPAGEIAVVTSPLRPMIVAMPIQSVPGSSETASHADLELAEFEAIDLDAQLQRLEKLVETPSKAKSKAVNEALDRIKIWQTTELELDDGKDMVDQLMKDLDLLHRENKAHHPILEMSLGLARDVAIALEKYEDLKHSLKTSEFCKATHEANMVDYRKQKSELDLMVAEFKKTKSTADELEKHIEGLQQQLGLLREREEKLGAGLAKKTKATFLVQGTVSVSRHALEIAETSILQGVVLQKEISAKKAGLQEILKSLSL